MTDQMTFGTLTIFYDDRILQPREWTLAQSEWAAALMVAAPDGPVLELCSGAGHIGLAAVARSARRLVCVDSSAVACEYARVNARLAQMEDRVEVREALLESALTSDEQFPVIIADPPWVPRALTSSFPDDPLGAIDGGPGGLDVARACLDVIAAHLAEGGSAVLQLGTTAQADALRGHPCFTDGGLLMSEVRENVRGVLARIDRPTAAG